ncbi:MAG: hypothetical protein LBL02_00390 [Endomicrobium sp.]|nr:hypothetical protein [Endomicrobium sp.]
MIELLELKKKNMSKQLKLGIFVFFGLVAMVVSVIVAGGFTLKKLIMFMLNLTIFLELPKS